MKWHALKWQVSSEDCGIVNLSLSTPTRKARPWILTSYGGNYDQGDLHVWGAQMAHCLPKTSEWQCIESRGHFCLYVLSNIWNATKTLPTTSLQSIKTPVGVAKASDLYFAHQLHCKCKLASMYIHREMVFSCTITCIFVRNCCPIQFKRLKVWSERDCSQDSSILLQKLEGMQQMMMRIAGREWLLS